MTWIAAGEVAPDDILSLSALVNALRDLSNENPGLQFKLSLRSDVYFLLRTSDESTDKSEGSVVWFTWTNHEILALLAKRIQTFWGNNYDEAHLLAMEQWELDQFFRPVLAARYRGLGKWSDVPTYKVLMSLVRRRPRDIVKLCSLAAHHARECGRDTIISEDLTSVFEEYSQGRVQDTINEFRSELPDIERLILNMKPNKVERLASAGYVYTTDLLLKKITNIASQGEFTLAGSPKHLPENWRNFSTRSTSSQHEKGCSAASWIGDISKRIAICRVILLISAMTGKYILHTGGHSSPRT